MFSALAYVLISMSVACLGLGLAITYEHAADKEGSVWAVWWVAIAVLFSVWAVILMLVAIQERARLAARIEEALKRKGDER